MFLGKSELLFMNNAMRERVKISIPILKVPGTTGEDVSLATVEFYLKKYSLDK